jgi:hypothetical protein
VSKPNGNGKANGKPKAPEAPPPPTPPLSEDEALAIAHGAASSAYDFLSSMRAADTDTLPQGRYWYAGGEVEDAQKTSEHLAELKRFVLDHPGVPASAAYVHMTRDVRRRRIVTHWHELPLPMRQAYVMFVCVLPPMVIEARREAKHAAELETPPPAPLPNRGMFKRIDEQVSNRAVRGHFSHDQKGDVAR